MHPTPDKVERVGKAYLALESGAIGGLEGKRSCGEKGSAYDVAPPKSDVKGVTETISKQS